MMGIIGAGNIGLAVAGELSKKNNAALIYTDKKMPSEICVDDEKYGTYFYNPIFTDSIEFLCKKCKIIILTYPSFLFKNICDRIEPYIQKDTVIIAVPGTGGAEFTFKKLIDRGVILVGLQRVPAVYRYDRVENIVRVRGRRKEGLFVSSIPKKSHDFLDVLIDDIFSMSYKIVPNYLNITLIPSNSILHTCRLYALFKNSTPSDRFDRNIKFYGEWDDETSSLIIKCNDELFNILSKFKEIDTSGIESILDHYESHDAISLTDKIKSISSLNKLDSPMLLVDKKYVIDCNSRYFLADFPNGLFLINLT